MKTKYATLLLLSSCLLLCSFQARAQQDEKLTPRLQKLFAKEKYQKCQRLATKLRRKHPQSPVPVYYLSRLAYLAHSQEQDPGNGRAWKHLKEATQLASLLPSTGPYAGWKDSMRHALHAYVVAQHDSSQLAMRPQLALNHFEAAFAERHPLHDHYIPTGEGAPLSSELSLLTTQDQRRQIITMAESLVGTPYRYAGTQPEHGFDCSGFTQYVYKAVGLHLPHNAHMQSLLSTEQIALHDAQPGDLIFFGTSYEGGHRTQHAGIFHSRVEGEIKVIHCVSRGVSIDGNNSSWENYWKERVLFVQRLEDIVTAAEK